MYSNVKQLRYNGLRRPDQEFNNDPGANGRIQVVRVGGYVRISVERWGDHSPRSKLLPPLYDAYCEGWDGDLMRWCGYQRADDKSPTYLQVWIVRILGQRPPSGSQDIHGQH